MLKFSSLLKDLPTLHEYRMSSTGYAVWIVWNGELSEAVSSTLRDYGGMLIAEESFQALWFFYSKDVFHGAARLQVWANLNDLPVFIQILPTNLMIGFQLEKALSIPSELYSQQAMRPEKFSVWVHPKVRPDAEGLPGLTLEPVEVRATGLAPASWLQLYGDPRISMPSSLGWFFVLKPLGNPLDKAFQDGWRNLFGELETILKRLKFKFMVHEGFLLFALDSYKGLDTWCREVLSLVRRLKAEESEEHHYWPSVMLAVEKAGYQFNEELPNKVPIEWDQMAPDFPHMSYRSAFLLGKRFRIKDVSYSFERSKVSDWCYVHLADLENGEAEQGSLNITIPVGLLAGKERPCFYCGLRTHEEKDCPSRKLHDLDSSCWGDVSMMGLDGINDALAELGEQVKDDPVGGVSKALTSGDPGGTIMRCLMEINAASQLRTAPLIWRSVGKDLPDGLTRLAPPDANSLYKSYSALVDGEASHADQMVKEGEMRNPRDYPWKTLQGFLALERGDLDRAVAHWKEAEPLGDSPIHFAYHKYLQARALEVQSRYDAAMALYKEARVLCPAWIEPLYRQAVCMVKMGFSEHAVGLIDQIVDEDPNAFNRIIIDPEAERGVVHILASLHSRWLAAEAGASEGAERLKQLSAEVEDWFGADHEFNKQIQRQISAVLALAEVQNYVVFHRLFSGKSKVEKALKNRVDKEIGVLGKQAEQFRNRLKDIHKEISWFPFPRTLREFNKDFNYCVTKLNWVKQQHFKVARNFRLSHEYFQVVDEKIKRLSSRLVTLRIVRDATLFMLLMGKSFMWLEIVGLGLALLGAPATVFVAEHYNYTWLTNLIEGQRWNIQKGLIIIVSVLALSVSLLKTALVFDKRKEKFFDEQRRLAAKHAGNGKNGKKSKK
ncbi:tetratricopeptide repeat protein [Desulfocurvus sp. DL9XJH121]